MEKLWIYKPAPPEEQIAALSEAINISPVLASLLLQRNISDFETARNFFRPFLENLHDPFLMQDMEKAVNRLNLAIQNEEKILVYGDYDVDGTTAVSLFYGFLKKRYPHLDFYIPDRYAEGYGVSRKGIEWAAENNFKLIISLDCGIKSAGQIELANSYGIDFIVCDHHNPGDSIPPAFAVLDPKRKDCAYPYKELSGCGVGFKLLQAFCLKNEIPLTELYSYLDLLCVSIASDIVPITGENRIFAWHGLKTLNENPRAGMKALMEVAGLKKEIDITGIVFGLGPRINAAGRIAHAKTAVHLMLSNNHDEALTFAKQINERNLQRRDFDATITEEAIEMIESDAWIRQAKSTVLFKEDWHKGVIGIVASRCIEKYYKPTIILTKNKEYATGSARSVDGFDVYEAICQCSDLLEQFGGHMYAAGLSLKLENVAAFREKFEEVVSSVIRPEQLIPRIEVDLKIPLDQINNKFYRILRQMAPFGPLNMQPLFVSEQVYDDGKGRLLKDEHIKLNLKQGASPAIDAIGFGMGRYFSRIKNGEKFDVLYHISENEYNGRKSLQLMIKDLRFPG